MTDDASIRIHRRGPVAHLELNRPKSINALDHEMSLTMEHALRDWEDDDSVGVVVVTGAGERGLCAGGDIVAIHRDAAELSDGEHDDHDAAASPSGQFWRDEYRLNNYIGGYRKPYVAIMDGIVMGGGVGISAHGNVRIVTDRTRLAMPEVGIGFVPDVGGTHLLARVPDQFGTYLALTAAPIGGAEAIALGLADYYIPAERLDDFLIALSDRDIAEVIADFAARPPVAELLAQRELIAQAFAADDVDEIVERCRAFGSEFAATTAERIAVKSPVACKVALRSLREAESTASLADSLRREYRVSLRALFHPDLAEGIRAQVIDKDRSPKWQSAASIGDEVVGAFFEPLPADVELTFALVGDARSV